MRQKEQRKLIKEQVRLFLLVPILVGLVISLGFIWIMGTLRFFAIDEWQQFTRLFLIDYSLYLFCWALTAVFLYRRIEKWR
jgi:ABC-type antimicrobial peptide transport system permease subunit